MDVFEAVRTVLAVRTYRPGPIPHDVVARIVEAGRLTGSSMNQQPWHFVVVDDKANDKLIKSIRNVEAHQFLPPEGVNVYDLLRHDHLVVSKGAAKALEARLVTEK